MRPVIQQLGVLSPPIHERLENSLLEIEDLAAQVLIDLRALADQGYSVDSLKSELDGYSTRVAALHAQVQTASSDADAADIRTAIESLRAQVNNELGRTTGLRQRAGEMSQVRGLLYGVGAMAVAGGLAALVWRGSKRRRRR